MPLPTQGLSTTNVLCESLPQGVSELQEVKIKGSKKTVLIEEIVKFLVIMMLLENLIELVIGGFETSSMT